MPAAPRFGFVNKIKAHIEILDPVTWISVFPCLAGGVMASGAMQPTVHDYLLLTALFLLYGPRGTGLSQSVNDYYDLELDKVNEPTRPIPSGRLTEKEAIWNWSIVLVVATLLSTWLGTHIGGPRGMVFASALFTGLFVGSSIRHHRSSLKKIFSFQHRRLGSPMALSPGFRQMRFSAKSGLR